MLGGWTLLHLPTPYFYYLLASVFAESKHGYVSWTRWPSGRGDGGDFDGGDRVVEHQHRFVKANAVEPLLALFKYFLNHRTLLVLQSVALLRLSSTCLDG